MRTTICLLLPFIFLAIPAFALNQMTLVGDYGGQGSDNYFGQAMTAGDFDDDGMEEFVISAYGWNNNTGKNYFYQYDGGWPAVPYMTVQGAQEYESYGYSTSNLGDINNDGLPDLGIPVRDFGPLEYSRLDVFFGSVQFDTIPDWSISPGVPVISYASQMDSCGDVNGDGWNDFILKILHNYDQPTGWEIYHGGDILDSIPDWSINTSSTFYTFVSGLGDVNGDPYNDILLLDVNYNPPMLYFGGSVMDTIPDLVFYEYASQGIGKGVGDVNGDGNNDFCMSMHLPDSSGYYGCVYFGGPDVDNVPDKFLKDEWGELQAPDWCISCGDFNGDGYNDIVSSVSISIRRVYIYLGGPWFNGFPDALVTDNSIWYGYGENVASGDIDGDGCDELLVAALNGYGFDTGRVYLYDGPEEWIDYGAGVEPGDIKHVPGWFVLEQNYPNPFNTSTMIHFEIGKPSVVNMAIYDLQGNKIKEIIASQGMLPGGYNVSWTGRNESGQPVSSGVYLLEMQVDQYQEVKKMALLR